VMAVLVALVSTANPANAGPPPNGTVISHTAHVLTGDLARVATAEKISYVSRNNDVNSTIVTGVVVTPKPLIRLLHPLSQDKTVAWAHGTYGPSDRCAPSNSPVLDAPGDDSISPRLVELLEQGYTLAISDYQGLGTPGPTPYLVAKPEAQNVLDSALAARALNPWLSRNVIVSGHSQGGQAAIVAAEIASVYAPNLSIRGVLPVAPASNLDLLAAAIPGTEGNGFAVQAIYGLAAVDSSVHPSAILTPAAYTQAQALLAANACSGDFLATFAGYSAASLLRGGAFNPAIVAKLDVSSPGHANPNAPMRITQGADDAVIPASLTSDVLLPQECSWGGRVTLALYPGLDHDSINYTTGPGNPIGDDINWMQARFLGIPQLRSSC
jgi:pimeloyl-ACP methyl ester carboxylesterase